MKRKAVTNEQYDDGLVQTTNNQTISGQKTFTDNMTFSSGKRILVDRVSAVTGAGNLTIGGFNPGDVFVISDMTLDSGWTLRTDAISNTTGGISTTIGTSGLKFTNSTSGYVPGALAYVEGPTTVSVSFVGAWVSSFNWTFQRIGNLVNVTFPTMRVTATSGSTIAAATTTIPARFRPANTVRLQVVGTNNAIDQGQVFIDILSSGGINITNTPAVPAFTNAALCGPYGSSFTYSL